MSDDASEWIGMAEAVAMIGLADFSALKRMREVGVASRRAKADGRSYEFRRADVLALVELRADHVRPSVPKHHDALALAINEYWRMRGHEVNARVERVGFICEIRSDTLNGWPLK